MSGRSLLEKEVLKLYKTFLRSAKGKPGFEKTIKQEFRKHSLIPKNDSLRIEYILRKAYKKLEQIRDPHVSGMGHFMETKT